VCRYYSNHHHTKKSPQHVIQNFPPSRHAQVHRFGELLQSGFKLPYLGGALDVASYKAGVEIQHVLSPSPSEIFVSRPLTAL
jgi:hypothetical protein